MSRWCGVDSARGFPIFPSDPSSPFDPAAHTEGRDRTRGGPRDRPGNVLLSFARFEREIIGERTRDRTAATRRKGKLAGGHPVLDYDVEPRGYRLTANPIEAERARQIFALYLESESPSHSRQPRAVESGDVPPHVLGRIRLRCGRRCPGDLRFQTLPATQAGYRVRLRPRRLQDNDQGYAAFEAAEQARTANAK